MTDKIYECKDCLYEGRESDREPCEDCKYKSMAEQDPTNTKLMLMEANINGYTEGLKDASYVLTVSLPIPDNATNGDVIKAMFGDDKVSEFMCHTRIIAKVGNWFNEGVVAEFDNVWWNAPYQKVRNQMAKALKCDRCGQYYDLLKGLRNYQIRDMNNEKNFDKPVDLCPDCYEIFTKWLTGEKPLYQLDPISDLADSVYGTGELYPGEFEEDSE